jgi:hypothetical protein
MDNAFALLDVKHVMGSISSALNVMLGIILTLELV